MLILDSVIDSEEPSWFYPKDGYFKNADLPPNKSAIFPLCNQNMILKKYLNLNLNFSECFDSQRVNRPYCCNPKGYIPMLILECNRQ